MPVLPGAEPIAYDGDDVGVLLCHGFTSTPASLAGWAERMAKDGRTVRVPRLPGHGTTWQEMNRTRWEDWYVTVEAALIALRERCDQVVANDFGANAGRKDRLRSSTLFINYNALRWLTLTAGGGYTVRQSSVAAASYNGAVVNLGAQVRFE